MLVQSMKEHFEVGKDDDLLNLLADMEATLNKARYLLKEQPEEGEYEEGEEEEEKGGVEVEISVSSSPRKVVEAAQRKMS